MNQSNDVPFPPTTRELLLEEEARVVAEGVDNQARFGDDDDDRWVVVSQEDITPSFPTE